MHPWEERFKGISPIAKQQMLRELEDHIALRGKRLLETEEIEEMLTLLPPDYFRALMRYKVDRVRRRIAEFPETIASFEEAVASLTDECKEYFSLEEDDEGRDQFLRVLDRVQIYHPALWFKVYKNIAELNISWAVEMEAVDKKEQFLPL